MSTSTSTSNHPPVENLSETFPAFTEFDLLVALTASPDCETVLSVDYEELEKISDESPINPPFCFKIPVGFLKS